MWAKNLGAIPLSAIACKVRVEPKVHEFATLRTEMAITALKMEGRILTPASWMASTNGEALELEPEDFSRRGSVDFMIKPRMKRLTM